MTSIAYVHSLPSLSPLALNLRTALVDGCVRRDMTNLGDTELYKVSFDLQHAAEKLEHTHRQGGLALWVLKFHERIAAGPAAEEISPTIEGALRAVQDLEKEYPYDEMEAYFDRLAETLIAGVDRFLKGVDEALAPIRLSEASEDSVRSFLAVADSVFREGFAKKALKVCEEAIETTVALQDARLRLDLFIELTTLISRIDAAEGKDTYPREGAGETWETLIRATWKIENRKERVDTLIALAEWAHENESPDFARNIYSDARIACYELKPGEGVERLVTIASRVARKKDEFWAPGIFESAIEEAEKIKDGEETGRTGGEMKRIAAAIAEADLNEESKGKLMERLSEAARRTRDGNPYGPEDLEAIAAIFETSGMTLHALELRQPTARAAEKLARAFAGPEDPAEMLSFIADHIVRVAEIVDDGTKDGWAYVSLKTCIDAARNVLSSESRAKILKNTARALATRAAGEGRIVLFGEIVASADNIEVPRYREETLQEIASQLEKAGLGAEAGPLLDRIRRLRGEKRP